MYFGFVFTHTLRSGGKRCQVLTACCPNPLNPVGVTAAGLDAAFQGLEIATHIKEKFSATEMLEVGITAGFNQAANLEIASAGQSITQSEKTLIWLKATAKTQVITQFTQLAAGHGFNFKAVTTALAT
jgi:hypothetical protein